MRKRSPKVLKPGSVDGRPAAIKDEDIPRLKALMRLKPTLKDTAAFFECSEVTIENTIRKHFNLTFFDFRDQNAVHTRLDLQRKAIEMARSGNVPMLIFSLKNQCGWSDKQTMEISGAEGAPIQVQDVTIPLEERIKLLKGIK